jgi:plastocyanin domain-containing protein
MNQLIIAAASLGLIGLIVWWFFGKPKAAITSAQTSEGSQTAEITVSGGYTPNRIQLAQGVPAKLIFHRKDSSSCFDEVVLPDFGIKTKLPVGQPYTVEITPDTAGNFKYSCGMNMFHGEIIVK